MLVPTKANQKKWIKEHLNGGVCPKTISVYLKEIVRRDITACYAALDWLSGTNIKTLAEAWRRCTRPSWLLWMLWQMKPDAQDVEKLDTLVQTLKDQLDYTSETYDPGTSDYSPFAAFRFVMLGLNDVECGYSKFGNAGFSEHQRQIAVKAIRQLWPNPWKF